MDSQEPKYRPSRREGTASPRRIALTLAGILAGVALLGWAVFAFAGALVAPPAPTPAPAPVAAVPKATTSTPPVKTDSAVPSEPATTAPKVAAAPVVPVPTAKPAPAPAPAAPKPTTRYVVVIDPGHQAQGSNAPDPIGPGSSQTKPAVAGGATGVATNRPESLDNLQISLKLRDALQAQGVTVYMVRTKQKVNFSNSERAKFANDHHADLFVRVHCDSGPSNVTGFLTLVPGKNQWTAPIVARSGVAGRDVQAAAIAATGAHDRGVTQRNDLSGFNWCKVPSVLVECGMMSNPGEDRALASASYQAKIAAGVAAGTMKYLRSH